MSNQTEAPGLDCGRGLHISSLKSLLPANPFGCASLLSRRGRLKFLKEIVMKKYIFTSVMLVVLVLVGTLFYHIW